MTLSSESLGGRLREARLAAGLSQTELSQKCGIPKPTLSRYENDHVSPSIHTLLRLAAALGVAENTLLHDIVTPEDAFLQGLHERGVFFQTVADALSAAEKVADALQAGPQRKRRSG
jgi:transcriptional regulator with XRE-family HTH domain